MRHHRGITVFLFAVLALGAGYFFGRSHARSNAALTPAAAHTLTVRSSNVAHAANATMPAPVHLPTFARTHPHSSAESAPLPPAGTPLKQTYDDLAARAKAGDAAASMRLFHDLQRCNKRANQMQLLNAIDSWRNPAPGSASPEQIAAIVKQANDDQQHLLTALKATDQLCAEIPEDAINHFGEWLRTAALDGDAQAMVCYAGTPNDFGPKYLSTAWFDWMQRWRDEAPRFAAQAYAAGQADVVALLQDAYSDDQNFLNERMPQFSYGQLVTPDPVLAAGYAMLYERLVPQSAIQSSHRVVIEHEAHLTSAQIEQARTFSDAAWPRFAAQAGRHGNLLPCIESRQANNPDR